MQKIPLLCTSCFLDVSMLYCKTGNGVYNLCTCIHNAMQLLPPLLIPLVTHL